MSDIISVIFCLHANIGVLLLYSTCSEKLQFGNHYMEYNESVAEEKGICASREGAIALAR